jgi:hypothetical protein
MKGDYRQSALAPNDAAAGNARLGHLSADEPESKTAVNAETIAGYAAGAMRVTKKGNESNRLHFMNIKAKFLLRRRSANAATKCGLISKQFPESPNFTVLAGNKFAGRSASPG